MMKRIEQPFHEGESRVVYEAWLVTLKQRIKNHTDKDLFNINLNQLTIVEVKVYYTII